MDINQFDSSKSGTEVNNVQSISWAKQKTSLVGLIICSYISTPFQKLADPEWLSITAQSVWVGEKFPKF